MAKWQFDQQYIKDLIDRGFILLKSPKIPKDKKGLIKEDINFFSEILKGNFEYQEEEQAFSNLKHLKRYIINKMRKQYEILGPNLINIIIALNCERIFDFSCSMPQTILTMDEQEELTLKNYERHSSILLNYARFLFSSKPTSLIQCVENLDCSSYCYYSDINMLPFFIINPTDCAGILNHEIQHGIEHMLSINNSSLLSEEGAILFELLYIDILFEKQNYLFSGDIERLDEATFQISYISVYFEVMKEFAKANFQVPMSKFLETFGEYFKVSQENLQEFLSEEMVSTGIDEDLRYLLSYLKAIKLRNYINMTSADAFEVLKSQVNTPIFASDNLKQDFKVYESYIDEMKQKSRSR